MTFDISEVYILYIGEQVDGLDKGHIEYWSYQIYNVLKAYLVEEGTYFNQNLANQINPKSRYFCFKYLFDILNFHSEIILQLATMLHKKRDEFVRQIRRKQIDQLFKQRRQLLQGPTLLQIRQSFQFNDLAKHISSSLDSINTNLKLGDYDEVFLALDFLIGAVKDKKVEASTFLLILADKCAHLIFNIVKNQEKMDEKNEWKKLSSQLQQRSLQRILYILSSMTYKQVNDEEYFSLLTSFWSIFSSEQICLFGKECQYILDLVLSTIKAMLSSRNQTVLKRLKSMGLGSQLAKIISYEIKTLNQRQQLQLVQIIQYYIEQEIHFGEVTSNEINGVYILGLESNEKQILLAYCLYLIDHKRQRTYLSALRALILIFEKHEYLSSTIQSKYVKQISQIINYPIRAIQLKAFELLDDIIHHNYQAGHNLLDKMYLPNLLFQKLQREMKTNDDHTQFVVERCANILCNLTLGRLDKPIKKQLQFHPIWELAYQNIVEGSPLFPLVQVFEYYFQIIPRQLAVRVLESYLSSVGQLNLKDIGRPIYQSIKRTLMRVYYQAQDFWPEGYEEDYLLNMIRQNGLTSLVQEVMDVEPEVNSL